MSDCKINQFMEFGDILYIIALIFFFVFGIFNDARKKKKQVSQNTPPLNQEVFPERIPKRQVPKTIKSRVKENLPPPAPKPVHREFQSSLDLVSNYEGQSSIKSSIFVDDLREHYKEQRETQAVHPILKELKSEGGSEEIRKAIIYSEILQRKY